MRNPQRAGKHTYISFGRSGAPTRDVISISRAADPSDERLVNDAQQGDVIALDTLFRRYYPDVIRFGAYLTSDCESAADLAQEAFLTAMMRIHRLKDGGFLPWIIQIMKYKYCSQLRLQRWHSLERLLEESPAVELSLLSALDAGVDQVGERDHIAQTLEVMSPILRAALLQRHVAGASTSTIASITGVSQAAAQRRAHRAETEFTRQYALIDTSDQRAPAS
jgi:RNA polymerase sigma-70 factor, ECF subfamily